MKFQDFFNWKRIIFELGKNYIFNPKASGYLTDLISQCSEFPGTLGTLISLSFSHHKHTDTAGPLHLLSAFGIQVSRPCSLLHLTFSQVVNTLLRKAFLNHPIKKSAVLLSLLCITLLRSPYHCLPWLSISIYFLFVFFPNKNVSFMRTGT